MSSSGRSIIKKGLIFFAITVAALILPEALTGFRGSVENFPYYSHIDLARALALGIASVCFAVVGRSLQKSVGLPSLFSDGKGFFTSLFVGQAALFLYVYIRSTLNEYVYYVPVTTIEIFVLVGLASYSLLRKKPSIVGGGIVMLNNIGLQSIIGAIFFLCVAISLAAHELPRYVMLSSDPDQHAFYTSQIVKFGTIPYHQFNWGDQGYNYPAGTGVLGFIWTVLSGLDPRNAFTIQPLLQSYIAIFIISEWALYRANITSARSIVFVYATVLAVFSYVLPYSMEHSSFHLEGAGRLSSISICAAVMVVFFNSLNMSNEKERGDLKATILGFCTLVFVAAALNPVNVFHVGIILAISFLCLHRVRAQDSLYVLSLFGAFLFLLMDPYYFQAVFGGGRNASEVVVYNQLDFSKDQFFEALSISFSKYYNSFFYEFFSFKLLNGGGNFVIVFCLLVAALSFISQKPLRVINIPLLAIGLLAIIWLAFLPVFDVLSVATEYRLFKPYFIYSNYQYLFIVIFLVVAMLSVSIIQRKTSKTSVFVTLGFVLVALYTFQLHNDAVNLDSRKNYCGSLGCASNDDLLVLQQVSNMYKLIEDSSNKNIVSEKILVPNMVLVLAGEKWLFPVGGSRMLPFHDLYPVAFYYGQGYEDYSYSNYNKYVCESFDTEWLKTRQIRYLFLPSEMLSACVFDLNNIVETKKIMFRHGAAQFIQLY
jgi:hypothetical protein